MTPTPAAWLEPAAVRHAQLLLDSYRRWLHVDLVPRDGSLEAQAQRLFDAPFVVVSHDTQADPVLNYANRTALELWETDWATLLTMPSRLTAEPLHRDERARLLERTRAAGYVDDYRGVRISTRGRRFLVERATVWNLIDPTDQLQGQAATFANWQFLPQATH